MTRQQARRLAANAALSAVEEHAALILLSRGHDSDDDENWPKITAELGRIENQLRRMADVVKGDVMTFRYFRLMGRCCDGAERDSGSRFHALAPGNWKALCGAQPGRRSAGWSSWEGTAATCPRCAKLVKVFEKATAELGTPGR